MRVDLFMRMACTGLFNAEFLGGYRQVNGNSVVSNNHRIGTFGFAPGEVLPQNLLKVIYMANPDVKPRIFDF